MKLPIDNNLPPRLARSLNILFVDHEVVALREKFQTDATDIDWVTALDREGGWAVLTRDLHIRTRPTSGRCSTARAWSSSSSPGVGKSIRSRRRLPADTLVAEDGGANQTRRARPLRAADQSGVEAETASEVKRVIAKTIWRMSPRALTRDSWPWGWRVRQFGLASPAIARRVALL